MKLPRVVSLVRSLGVSVILAASTHAAHAAPCTNDFGLSNCGFDAPLGSLNWDQSGEAKQEITIVRNGAGSLFAAGDGGDGGVSQGGLDANPAGSIGYKLDFWLRFGDVNTNLDLASFVTVSVNGSPLTGISPGVAVDDWTPFSGLIDKVANDWVLAFAFTDPVADDLFMDDVVLTARAAPNGVPEPGSLLLVGVALASVALVRRRKTN